MLKSLLYSALLLAVSFNVAAKDWTGSIFPAFNLQNQKGEWVNNQVFKDQWVAYYFYPRDHTKGCSIEAANFAESYKKLKAKRTQNLENL